MSAELRQRAWTTWGRGAQFVIAPGRVNLVGEHTDTHDGLVLPAAIERYVAASGRRRDDDVVVVRSRTFSDEHRFELGAPMGSPPGWARRAEGIVRRVLGTARTGLEALVDSDLPVGGGLSSSAASMAALGELAARLNGVTLERVAFARTLRQAEHDFAGVRCGLMDPLAILLGKRQHALLIDCRTISTELVALPEQWALVVLDTGVKHELANSAYNERLRECASVLEAVAQRHPGVRALRDVTPDVLEETRARVDATGLRRCRHVLTENARVVAASAALANADGPALSSLFAASHASLRDDYEVSCRELDAMVDAARTAPGCVAARMTGGGFGGSTVNLVDRHEVEAFVSAALERYLAATGRTGHAIVTAAADGLRSEEL